MDEALLALLRSVDTPTVCNAIEMAEGRRGFDRFTRGTVLCSDPGAGPVIGYARTARIAAARPPTDPPEAIRTRRMDYYRYMAEAPKPAIVVIEDTDPDPVGAFWGEINTSVHKGFGLSGVLTNGVMRDLGDLAPDFPVIAGSIGPSHAFVHVRDIDLPVTVFGLTVQPGDLIHADRHGAVVIPEDRTGQIAGAITRLVETEKIVLGAAQRQEFDFAAFQEAWTAFEKARV